MFVWVVVLRLPKKHHSLLGELSPEEMAEYQVVANEVEQALRELFQFDVIHHLLLMVKDKHTHFHILPRYKENRNFANLVWEDDLSSVPLGNHNLVDQEVLNQIRDNIKQKIGK